MTDETVETCVKCGNPCTGGSRFSQTVDKAGNLLSETHTCFTCADAEDLADYCKTDVIRTKMMTRGVILVHQIQEALKRVVDECDAKSAALFARLVAGEDVPLDDPTRQEFERIVDGIRGRLTLDEVAPLGRIHESTGHIEDEVAKFETDVWFGGAVPLQAMIQSAGKKGHAASFTDSDGREISVLSYAMTSGSQSRYRPSTPPSGPSARRATCRAGSPRT